MINTPLAVITWLSADAGVVAAIVTADHLVSPDLPEGFDCLKNGDKGVQIQTRGGSNEAEMPIQNPSVQLTCWALTPEDALAIYGAVRNAMHQQNDIDCGAAGYVMSSMEEMIGQQITDPDTGWATVVTAYRLMIRAN